MPLLAPTSYPALALSYGINHLTGSATWAAKMTALGLAAGDRVVESFGGMPTSVLGGGSAAQIGKNQAVATTGVQFAIAPPYAEVHEEAFPSDEIALNQWRYTGVVHYHIVLPLVATDAPPEVLRRMRNDAGAIRAEMEAQFAQANRFARGRIEIVKLWINDETGVRKNSTSALLDLHWSSP